MKQKSFAEYIRSYEYVSPQLSLCERLFLDRFWTAVAGWYPPWLAPNLVTLTGFVFVLFSYLTILVWSPMLNGQTPSWFGLIVFVCTFLYQTCDGSDGKQARRTGSGSPLGELFDHGVDALVSVVIVAQGVELGGLGLDSAPVVVLLLLTQVAFFASNQTLLVTGRQLFNDFDCQEAELFVQVVGLVVLVFGRGAVRWLLPAPGWVGALTGIMPGVVLQSHPEYGPKAAADGGVSVDIGPMLAALACCCLFVNIVRCYMYLDSYAHRDSAVHVPPGRSQTDACWQLVWCLASQGVSLVGWMCARQCVDDPFALASWLLVLQVAFAYTLAQLLLVRICGVSFATLHSAAGLCMNATMLAVNAVDITWPGVPTVYMQATRAAIVVATVVVYGRFVSGYGQKVAGVLGIRIFMLKP